MKPKPSVKTKDSAKVKPAPKKKLHLKVRRRPKKAAAASVVETRTGLFNLHAPKGAHKKRKYLGRGPSSGHGKTSTRGSKGQTSRAGRHFYLGFEGGQSPLIRRFPKRGFFNISRKVYQVVNLRNLAALKEQNITLELLQASGLIKDKFKLVKILGAGEVKSPLNVQAHAFSAKAQEAIKKAGGKIEVVAIAKS